MAPPQKGDPSLDAGQAGEEIRYLLGDSSLDRILVASSGRGLVSILMGEDEEFLIEDRSVVSPRCNSSVGMARKTGIGESSCSPSPKTRPAGST